MLGNSTYLAPSHGYTATVADTFIKANVTILINLVILFGWYTIKCIIWCDQSKNQDGS